MDFEFEELEKINAYMQMAFIEETISQEECLREIQDVISYSKKIKRSKSWEGTKKMPQLYHTLPNQDFSFADSEVLSWLGTQYEVLDWLRNSLYKNNYIKFNSDTKMWQGVDFDEGSNFNT